MCGPAPGARGCIPCIFKGLYLREEAARAQAKRANELEHRRLAVPPKCPSTSPTLWYILHLQVKGARHVEPPHGVPLHARALLQVGGRGAGLLRSHVRGEALGTLRARRLDQRCLVRVRSRV